MIREWTKISNQLVSALPRAYLLKKRPNVEVFIFVTFRKFLA